MLIELLIVILKQKEGLAPVQCETCKSVNWSHMSHVHMSFSVFHLYRTETRHLRVKLSSCCAQYGTCMVKCGTPTLRCEGAGVGGQAARLCKENVGTLGGRQDVIREDYLFVK